MIKTLILAALLLAASTARADIIYDWQGDCTTGCIGTASAQIVLRDTYVPGQPFVDNPAAEQPEQYYISFLYSDSYDSYFFGLFHHDELFGNGTLPEDFGPGILKWCYVFCTDFGFTSTAAGDWRFKVDLGGYHPDDVASHVATGSHSVFTRTISEPGSLALLLLGLAGIGLARRGR